MLEIRTEPLHPNDWLGVIEREYFKDFLQRRRRGGEIRHRRRGGARGNPKRVRGAGAPAWPAARASLGRRNEAAHGAGVVLRAWSACCPGTGCCSVTWKNCSRRHEHPWPRPGTAMGTAELADAFGIAPGIMTRHRDQWLSRDLWDDPRLARDFRAAMIALCLSRLDPQDGGGAANTPGASVAAR